MSRFFSLMAALLLVVVVLGCQSDIVLPPDTPLKGTYEGVYSYTTDFGSESDRVVLEAHVIFIFDETAYHMNLDASYVDQWCFCAVDGKYALTEGVRLKEEHSVSDGACGGGRVCNPDLNPDGVFDRQTKNDSLILKMQEGTTLRMLRLLKLSD